MWYDSIEFLNYKSILGVNGEVKAILKEYNMLYRKPNQIIAQLGTMGIKSPTNKQLTNYIDRCKRKLLNMNFKGTVGQFTEYQFQNSWHSNIERDRLFVVHLW
jgi:hypothetical protein